MNNKSAITILSLMTIFCSPNLYSTGALPDLTRAAPLENSCYYKYDKNGRLLSVEFSENRSKNEYYTYDARGNITEKRLGARSIQYEYDAANQLRRMISDGEIRDYCYDEAGRLITESVNGQVCVEYKYGYLDKVIEIIRDGESVQFVYDGFGMLTEKRFQDGHIEKWVWDGLALVRRGGDIYVNEPHVSGGIPIVTKTSMGVRYHEHDFLGSTLWSSDLAGNIVMEYHNTTIFGEGELQDDTAARFTGKPYDKDLQAYVFPNRDYDPSIKRWRTSDPSGYPDGINNQFYAVIPTIGLDPLGLKTYYIGGAGENTFGGPMQSTTCSQCGAQITGGTPYSWTDYDDILADIEATKQADPNEPINLVGHSYGGDTAYLVARDSSYTVDNLITIDPVSHFTFDVSKPGNVGNWDNVYSNPNNYGVDDFIADVGGQWGPVNDPNVNNISSPASHGDFGGLASSLPPSSLGIVHTCEK